MADVIDTIYVQENIFCLDPPTIEYRDYLTRRQAEMSKERIEEADRTMVAIFTELIKRFPASVFEKGQDDGQAHGFTVPLSAMLPDYRDIVNDLIAIFNESKSGDHHTFPRLSRTLAENMYRLSGMDIDKPITRKLTNPTEYDGDPSDYLQGTPFLDFFNQEVPFVIPRTAYAQHAAVFAPTGHGKTQTLQSIVINLLREPDPPPMFIMDSMGSMLKKIERLQLFNTTLKDRLVILDPNDDPPPALNFFKLRGGSPAQQMELFFYLFRAIDQTLTRRQATTLTYLVQLMQKVDGTLDTLRRVCEDKQPQHLDAIASLDPIARDFFTNKFYGAKDHLITQTKDQIVDRLYTLGANPVFHRMFSAKENKFNALECIEQKRIVLINTDRDFLGDDTSAVIGRFILAQCLAAALARAPLNPDKRHIALLVVDEAKQYFDEQTEKILSDARQFGLGLLFATQYVDQLPEGVRKAMYGNTSIKLIGPVTYSDRVNLAREMNTTPEFIGAMRSYDRSHAEFATHVRTDNLTPKAIKLDIPMGMLEREPQMDDTSYALMRQNNRIAVGPTVGTPPTSTAPPVPGQWSNDVSPPATSQPHSSPDWSSDQREPD